MEIKDKELKNLIINLNELIKLNIKVKKEEINRLKLIKESRREEMLREKELRIDDKVRREERKNEEKKNFEGVKKNFNILISIEDKIPKLFNENFKYKEFEQIYFYEFSPILFKEEGLDLEFLDDLVGKNLYYIDNKSELKKIRREYRLIYKRLVKEIKELVNEQYKEISKKIYFLCKEEGLTTISISKIQSFLIEIGETQNPDYKVIQELIKGKLFKKFKREVIKKEIKTKVLERDSHKCQICGDTDYLEIGHKYPVSKGGTNELKNLITLCRKCNSNIGTRIIK